MSKSRRPGAEEWRQIVDGHQRSGLTVSAYCLERGITQGSFYTWKQRLRTLAKSNRSPARGFVELKPSSLSAPGTIETCLPRERRLLVRHGFDRDLLVVDAIQTLEGLSSRSEGAAFEPLRECFLRQREFSPFLSSA